MRIEQRAVGRVTVLDLLGKITLGEGDELLREAMQRVVDAGNKLVVLNLGDVPYIDSSGLMEIVRSYTVLSRAGGRLWLADPTKRIRDLLTITKLLTVFEFVSIDEVADLEYEGLVVVACPMCEPATEFRVGSSEAELVCPVCSTEMNVRPWAPSERERLAICRHAVIPTYDGECLTFVAGEQDTVRIDQRLDLFVSEFVERLWNLLPSPRCAVFSARYANCTEAGLQKVLALCRPSPDGGGAGLRMPDVPDSVRARFAAEGAVILVNYGDEWNQLPRHSQETAGFRVRMRRA